MAAKRPDTGCVLRELWAGHQVICALATPGEGSGDRGQAIAADPGQRGRPGTEQRRTAPQSGRLENRAAVG